MKEKYSVALCTCNGEKYLQQQLESIINQTVQVDEIVVCDDESTDRTVNIAKTVLESTYIPYKIVVNTPRLGVTKNFEKCIGLCSGDIIFLSDQDDVWMENKVEVLSSIFSDKETVLAFSDAYVIDQNGEVINQSAYNRFRFLSKGINDFYIAEMLTRKQQGINGCFTVIRKALYDKITPFYDDDDDYKLYHDTWIEYCAGLSGKIVGIQDKLMCYRVHDSNVTQSAGVQDKWFSIVTSGDRYDQRFCLHTFRRQRNTILTEAIKIFPDVDNIYSRKYRKCIRMYERLIRYKEKNKACRIFMLLISFIDGAYYYRDISRNIENTIWHRSKLLVRDILFMLSW